jgi:hypothetical protein
VKVFLLLLFLGLALPVGAPAKVRDLTLEEIAPDQAFAGFGEVNAKAQEWSAAARRQVKGEGSSFEDALLRIVNKDLQQDVTAVVSPDGLVHITDAHHRVLAARKVLTDAGIPLKKAEVSVDVVKNFDGAKWNDYVKWREKNLPTFIPAALHREEMTTAQLVDYYQKLPTDFDKIEDLPMRSAVGKFFDELGIKGSAFEPFVQFRLGEELKAMGINVSAGEEYSFATQKKIRDAVFKGRDGPRLRKFLLSLASDEQGPAVTAALDRMSYLVRHEDPVALKSRSVDALYGKLSPDTDVTEISLPIPGNKTLIKKILLGSQERYAERVDPARLRKILKAIRDGEELSGTDVNYLKASRKAALNLKSAIKLLGSDSTKEDFADFLDFTTTLGNLNDRIQKWSKKGRFPDKLRDAAKKTLGLLDKKVGEADLTSATLAQFRARNAATLAWIKETIAQKTLSVGDYHKLRRRVRDYMGLMEIVDTQEPSPETTASLQYLRTLNKKMGKFKDGLGIPVGPGAEKEFDKSMTKIDPETKKDLKSLVGMLSQDEETPEPCPGAYKRVE